MLIIIFKRLNQFSGYKTDIQIHRRFFRISLSGRRLKIKKKQKTSLIDLFIV